MTDRIIGFTGARHGITVEQEKVVEFILSRAKPVEAHHGECRGGDAQFHAIALKLGIPVVGHPPLTDTYHAILEGYAREEKPLGYLNRDREIVHSSTILIGCPKLLRKFTGSTRMDKEYNPQRGAKDNPYRSGTWYTINYALSKGIEVIVVYPDGTIDRTEAKK